MIEETLKQAIITDYQNPDIRVIDIAKKYHVSRETVRKIILKSNIPLRRPRSHSITKVCPKCKKKIELANAKYCCFCGSDIRTNRQILIDRLDEIFPIITLLPSEMRNKSLATLKDIKNELQNN